MGGESFSPLGGPLSWPQVRMLLFPQGACTQLLCDARVCGCARQGPARRESPPSPSEDLGRRCLQPLGVRAGLCHGCLCLPAPIS